MINPRFSAVWSKTQPIALFSCTPRVQEVHTKAEVVHPAIGLLGLEVIFNSHLKEVIEFRTPCNFGHSCATLVIQEDDTFS